MGGRGHRSAFCSTHREDWLSTLHSAQAFLFKSSTSSSTATSTIPRTRSTAMLLQDTLRSIRRSLRWARCWKLRRRAWTHSGFFLRVQQPHTPTAPSSSTRCSTALSGWPADVVCPLHDIKGITMLLYVHSGGLSAINDVFGVYHIAHQKRVSQWREGLDELLKEE